MSQTKLVLRNYLPIILVVLLGLLLRLPALNQSFWLDEAINVQAARDNSLADLLFHYSQGDFHPPFFHFLLWVWFRLVGVSEVAARLPSLLASLITIWLTYLIGLKLFHPVGKNHALFAPLLLATSGLHIYYAQEARMYSLAACLTVLVFYFFLNLRTKKTLTNKILFVISLTFLLLTDYQPWLILPLFLYLLPGWSALGVLLTVPWWPYLSRQLTNGLAVAGAYPAWKSVVGALSLKSALLLPLKFLVGRVSLDNNFLFALAVSLPALVVTFLFYLAFREKGKDFRLVKLWLIVPLITAFFLSLKIPLFSYFRFLFLLPPFYLLLGHGLTKLKPTLTSILLGLLLVTNFISSFFYLNTPAFQREDWKSLAKFTNSLNQSESLVVFPNLAQSAAFTYYNKVRLPLSDLESLDLSAKPETIIYVRYVAEIFDPEGKLDQNLLNSGYLKQREISYPGILVWEYQRI